MDTVQLKLGDKKNNNRFDLRAIRQSNSRIRNKKLV